MVKGGDIVGYGESTCNQTPYYINETTETAWHILSKFIVPRIVGTNVSNPEDLINNKYYKAVRGNNFAKAGIELAVWDFIKSSWRK
jgi:O-succinylbenzoate synthase